MQSITGCTYKKYFLVILFIAVLSVKSQPDWRFGFEDTSAHLIGLMTDTQKRALLEKTAWLVESQPGHCDINFPAIQGGWKGMQPLEGGTIDFSKSDEPTQHFWTDSMESLLRTHRIIYQAIHDADPSGHTKLISSGGVLWDLYSDFPDYPEIEGPVVQSRLAGNNNHQVSYVQAFGRLKQILTSFGDDSDGIECDYIGWHPHMPWREIDQTFRLIHAYAGEKPIYIDDMWCNVFPVDQKDAPGNALFSKDALSKEGDFPNPLIPSYAILRQGLDSNNPDILSWYYGRHARTLVKAFVSAFGYGAERVSISGIADLWNDKLNLMGTMTQDFYEKPGYYTYRLMVDKLHDFSQVSEIQVSINPLTRMYKFQCPAGEVYAGWSETGDAPEDLDYTIPNGETVSFFMNAEAALRTQIISALDNLTPQTDTLLTSQNMLTLRLGYSPVFLEPLSSNTIVSDLRTVAPKKIKILQNYPNPFNDETHFLIELSEDTRFTLELLTLEGKSIGRIIDQKFYPAGRIMISYKSDHLPTGSYVYRFITDQQTIQTGKLILIK